jgi:ribosomal-protein-alanine N-acetyltransferase
MVTMGTFRPASAHDLHLLRGLETACFGRDAWSEEALRGELDGVPDTRYVLVAEDDGSVIGYASLLAIAGTADVQRIAVHPNAWRHGVGRELLRALLDEARRRGCLEALLEVRADNQGAIKLYEEFGFAPLARRAGYYDAGAVDAVVLRLELG